MVFSAPWMARFASSCFDFRDSRSLMCAVVWAASETSSYPYDSKSLRSSCFFSAIWRVTVSSSLSQPTTRSWASCHRRMQLAIANISTSVVSGAAPRLFCSSARFSASDSSFSCSSPTSSESVSHLCCCCSASVCAAMSSYMSLRRSRTAPSDHEEGGSSERFSNSFRYVFRADCEPSLERVVYPYQARASPATANRRRAG